MTAWLAAHLRLCAQLPHRTHYRAFGDSLSQGQRYPNGQLPPWLLDEYKQLRASGRTLKEIRNVLRVGPRTMDKLAVLSAKP